MSAASPAARRRVAGPRALRPSGVRRSSSTSAARGRGCWGRGSPPRPVRPSWGRATSRRPWLWWARARRRRARRGCGPAPRTPRGRCRTRSWSAPAALRRVLHPAQDVLLAAPHLGHGAPDAAALLLCHIIRSVQIAGLFSVSPGSDSGPVSRSKVQGPSP